MLQTAERLLTPHVEAKAISIRLELAPALPPVLADSNQILHVCMHLAGQISAQLNRTAHSTLLVHTHGQGDFVVVDFTSYDPSAGPSSHPLSFPTVFNSDSADQPSSLSLSACCRIVEEHGGRLLQRATPVNPAFRVELRVAASAASRPSFAPPNWAAASSSS